MSFASALNILHPTLPYYLALTRHGLLRINQHSYEFYPVMNDSYNARPTTLGIPDQL